MIQEEALKEITNSLTKDELVQAVYVKGSMGRGTHDEFSDIDLYCLVKEEDVERFLHNRLEHLRSYRRILFHEDIFIIAPQMIAVYDNLLHVDLFTVTEKTFREKDYFQILYDPDDVLSKFVGTQNLLLSREEFSGHAYDVAWYLFQYNKALKRGNDIWAVEMLQFVMRNLASVLLHRYQPNRAQLGLKALHTFLPKTKLEEIKNIFNHITLTNHSTSVSLLISLLHSEINWIESNLQDNSQAVTFLRMMVDVLKE